MRQFSVLALIPAILLLQYHGQVFAQEIGTQYFSVTPEGVPAETSDADVEPAPEPAGGASYGGQMPSQMQPVPAQVPPSAPVQAPPPAALQAQPATTDWTQMDAATLQQTLALGEGNYTLREKKLMRQRLQALLRNPQPAAGASAASGEASSRTGQGSVAPAVSAQPETSARDKIWKSIRERRYGNQGTQETGQSGYGR